MTKNSFTRVVLLYLMAFFFSNGSASGSSFEFGKPYFVGKLRIENSPAQMSTLPKSSNMYMTAKEMQSMVTFLTGFAHPAFDQFADALGKFDPGTGRRTVDTPSIISILFMQKISQEISEYVVQREIFFSDDERIVFGGVDLLSSPSQQDLGHFIDLLYTRWLNLPPGEPNILLIGEEFRRLEAAIGSPGAYARLLSLMIQHGGLYYY